MRGPADKYSACALQSPQPLLVLCALLAACGGDASRGDDVNANELSELRVTEDLRLGSVENPDSGFSRIGGVAVDAEGRIYVIERQDRQIRVFSSEGRRLHTFGGPGEGPGEFVNPESLGFRGDTLWVIDPQLLRVTMFSQQGAVLRTFPSVRSVRLASPSDGIITSSRGAVLRGDGLLHLETPSAIVLLSGTTTPPDSISAPILRLDRSAAVVDTADHLILYLIPSEDRGSPGRPAQTDMVLDPGPLFGTPLRSRDDQGRVVIERDLPVSSSHATFTATRMSDAGDTLYPPTL